MSHEVGPGFRGANNSWFTVFKRNSSAYPEAFVRCILFSSATALMHTPCMLSCLLVFRCRYPDLFVRGVRACVRAWLRDYANERAHFRKSINLFVAHSHVHRTQGLPTGSGTCKMRLITPTSITSCLFVSLKLLLSSARLIDENKSKRNCSPLEAILIKPLIVTRLKEREVKKFN